MSEVIPRSLHISLGVEKIYRCVFYVIHTVDIAYVQYTNQQNALSKIQ